MIDARTRLLLEDMLAHAEHAELYIAGLTPEIFVQTYVMIHAATRAVEVVGEAASQIPADVRKTMPTIHGVR